MRDMFIVLRQNTKGDKLATTSRLAYSSRDKANARKASLEKQARLSSADRASKPKFSVEPISIPD